MYLLFHLGISALNPGSNFFSWESNTQLSRSLAVTIFFILKKQNQKDLGFLWDIQIRLVQTHREIFFHFLAGVDWFQRKKPWKGNELWNKKRSKHQICTPTANPSSQQVPNIQDSGFCSISHRIKSPINIKIGDTVAQTFNNVILQWFYILKHPNFIKHCLILTKLFGKTLNKLQALKSSPLHRLESKNTYCPVLCFHSHFLVRHGA